MVDLVVELTVAEAAGRLGVSPRRIQALVAGGDLHAVRRGRDRFVSVLDIDRLAAVRRAPGRPATPSGAWRRLRSPGQTEAELDPGRLLSRTATRARRVLLQAHPSVLSRLAADGRVRLTGVSAAVDGVPDDELVEAYVEEAALQQLVDDYALLPASSSCNVVLRVVEDGLLPDDVPMLAVAVDLLDSLLPRHRGAGERLLAEQVAV
jgi:excisionase family DNA binding protein